MPDKQPRQYSRGTRSCRRRILQVILLDANLLVYSHVSSFAQHLAARAWLDSQLNGHSPVGPPVAQCFGVSAHSDESQDISETGTHGWRLEPGPGLARLRGRL